RITVKGRFCSCKLRRTSFNTLFRQGNLTHSLFQTTKILKNKLYISRLVGSFQYQSRQTMELPRAKGKRKVWRKPYRIVAASKISAGLLYKITSNLFGFFPNDPTQFWKILFY